MRWREVVNDALLTTFSLERANRPDVEPFRRALNATTEEGHRSQRLRDLLFAPGEETPIDGGRGTIVVDERHRTVALGWGWDPATDVRLDRIAYVAQPSPTLLVIDLPAPRLSLVLGFATELQTLRWRNRLEALTQPQNPSPF